MMGDHEGLAPLEDTTAIIQPAMVAMARLKAGKDVPERKKALTKIAASLSESDRYWPESFASLLTTNGYEAAVANTVALIVAAELRDSETAAIIRSVNSLQTDPWIGKCLNGLVAAAPEFGTRMKAGRVDSDEVMARVAVAHFFRRDPASIFHMFMIDALIHKLRKVWKGGINGFVEWAIDRPSDVPVPEDAIGYLVVLKDVTSRGGYYMFEPSGNANETLADITESWEGLSIKDTLPEMHYAWSTAIDSLYVGGRIPEFVALAGAIMKKFGHKYSVLAFTETDEGISTDLIDIPASSIAEAREMIRLIPKVKSFDGTRKLVEFMRQSLVDMNYKKDA
jgi:hypothetical protein